MKRPFACFYTNAQLDFLCLTCHVPVAFTGIVPIASCTTSPPSLRLVHWQEYELRCPNGMRKLQLANEEVEIFAEYLNPNGLVKRCVSRGGACCCGWSRRGPIFIALPLHLPAIFSRGAHCALALLPPPHTPPSSVKRYENEELQKVVSITHTYKHRKDCLIKYIFYPATDDVRTC